eukprot:CAMPEP_0170791222 /NCGR_PEP_ID=MMETSP0733-20121128/20997_1 /TAXON_ID=186038 /ORGANISM="Fragilariopsis kerguelensis, Strain L26-C5" /LENGTH=67 /DNA_ID=CAMNT_0011139073 /DNA_START=1 /DNA_END=200 /DNA_ORIENTATION=+
MSLSLKDALEKIVHDSSNAPTSPTTTETTLASTTTTTTTTVEKVEEEEDDDPLYGECKTVVPVVIFS